MNDHDDLDSYIIVEEIPKIFIQPFVKNKEIIGLDLDNNFESKLNDFTKEVNKVKNVDVLKIRGRYDLENIKSKKIFLVRNKKTKYITKRKIISETLLSLLLIFIFSLILTCASFLYTTSELNINSLKMILSYFEPHLFILNFLPIFVLMLLIYFLTKKVHVSWLCTSLLIFIWGVANQTKVFYRDDVIKFEDLMLLKEAFIMAEKLGVIIKLYTIAFAIFIIGLFFICKKYLKKLSIKLWQRIVAIVCILLCVFVGYKTIYSDINLYESLGNMDLVNKWIFTRQSQVRGLVYPFIISIRDAVVAEPEGYEKDKVVKILDDYKEESIPDDKKVNIIAVMLESFNDFSKFKTIDFNEDIYKEFHDIQDKSISGSLVTNIFGGGTVDTERSFLTGYKQHSGYRKTTDSYVRYFKNQGYNVESFHPIYGAFYNRNTINLNLGFNFYYNYENTYSKIQPNFVNDDLFFDSIIEKYNDNKQTKKPYFSFSVTYQIMFLIMIKHMKEKNIILLTLVWMK